MKTEIDLKKATWCGFVVLIILFIATISLEACHDANAQPRGTARENGILHERDSSRIFVEEKKVIWRHNFMIIDVDGHDYLQTSSGVTHMESCKCTKWDTDIDLSE